MIYVYFYFVTTMYDKHCRYRLNENRSCLKQVCMLFETQAGKQQRVFSIFLLIFVTEISIISVINGRYWPPTNQTPNPARESHGHPVNGCQLVQYMKQIAPIEIWCCLPPKPLSFETGLIGFIRMSNMLSYQDSGYLSSTVLGVSCWIM